MNNQEKDIYKDLFSKQVLDSPSMSFENSLMHRIRVEHIKQERKQNRWSIVFMVSGVLSVIILPAIILRMMGWTWSLKSLLGDGTSIFGQINKIEINPLAMLIGVLILFLLLLDSLIRKHLDKKEKDTHP